MTATDAKLLPEQALAKRWLRSRYAPLEVWQWLAGRAPNAKLTRWSAAPELRRLLSVLGKPLASQSCQQESAALERTLSVTASLLAFIQVKSRGPASACQRRMLAGCLLPLYRGLASGSVDDVTAVMRRQLADALSLSAMLDEFPGELAELVAVAVKQDKMPYEVLKSALNIDLEQVAQYVLTAARNWSGTDEAELHALISHELTAEPRPAWGTPESLWSLAGEITANRSEFVVPRAWMQVPVPWNEASEHWREIAKALDECRTCSDLPPDPDPEDETDTNQARLSEPSLHEVTAEDMDAVARLKMEIEIANSVDALVMSTRSAVRQAVQANSSSRHKAFVPAQEEFIIPKVIIAEIRSHNDPAFVAVIRRQLAVCRNDGRSVALIAARVQADGDGEGGIGTPLPTLKALGLATWQQKLVNWLADHPEVNDPYAFVSSQGELILCLMAIERNAATVLLRQGLVKVLTGRAIEGDAVSTLARVQIPARFHSGIASVSAPTASFEPEQLIEATYRCLAAAERHGKASIKSIEVF